MKYRVLERSFIDNALREEGAEIDFDGEAGPNLEPIEDAKPAKKASKDDPALA